MRERRCWRWRTAGRRAAQACRTGMTMANLSSPAQPGSGFSSSGDTATELFGNQRMKRIAELDDTFDQAEADRTLPGKRRKTKSGKGGIPPWKNGRLLLAAGGTAAALILAGVIILLKNNRGDIVGRLDVPENTSVTIQSKDGRDLVTVPASGASARVGSEAAPAPSSLPIYLAFGTGLALVAFSVWFLLCNQAEQDLANADAAKLGPAWKQVNVLACGGGAALAMLAGAMVIIANGRGEEVARIELPASHTVEVSARRKSQSRKLKSQSQTRKAESRKPKADAAP